jgi:hypothetical protein
LGYFIDLSIRRSCASTDERHQLQPSAATRGMEQLMSITKIIKGPHRFGGFWWVIADCGGQIQHICLRTEQQARTIAPGQDNVTLH